MSGVGIEANSAVERLIRRDRIIIALGLFVLLAISWSYLVSMGADMRSMIREGDMHVAMGMPEM